MKRGQVTIFIIVGIVLLFTTAFAIYIVSMMQKTETKISVDTTADATNRACLERISEGALIGVAASGGTEATATTPIADGSRVRVGIQGTGAAGQYGTFNLQPLCLRNGLNKPNAGGDGSNSCMSGTYQLFEPNERVIQYQLEQIITRALVETNCTVRGPVHVIFGGDDVSVTTDDTSIRVPVRFKRIYNLAYRFAIAEVRTKESSLLQVRSVTGCPEPNGECLLAGLVVDATPDELSPQLTLVTIRDVARPLRGEPFTYRFVIDNRAPVVTGSQETDGATTVNAFDPDEDTISIAPDSCPDGYACEGLKLIPSCSASGGEHLITVVDQHGLETSSMITLLAGSGIC